MTRKEMLKTLALTPLAGVAGSRLLQTIVPGKIAIKSAKANAMKLFSLGQVEIVDGPFKKAQETNHKYLLSLEPDRLLYWHRKAAGLKPKADHYGGWENSWGNIIGHYMSACAHMYGTAGDEKLKARLDYIVDELQTCQQHLGTGALYNAPQYRECIEKMQAGEFNYTELDPGYPFINGVNPWYHFHKVLAGLRDIYWYCNNEQAKKVMVRFADWAVDFSNSLSDEHFQKMLDVEHGGIAEVMADIYTITREKRHYHLAKRFVHKRMARPLAKGEDVLYPEHANTQVPKFSGYARLYEINPEGSKMEGQAAFNFWETVVQNHTLAIGGNGEIERFGESGKVSHRIGYSSAETCNTYNMLKLSKHLFKFSGQRKYIDYYERALYNHILAAIGPDEGMFCYFVSHKQGHFKTFSTAHDSNWCCVGTGMENPAKYGQVIYSHNKDDLYVNLFIPSVLDWKEKGFKIKQDTTFPEDNTTQLTIEEASDQLVTLKIREPEWVAKELQVKVNGKAIANKRAKNGYIAIQRNWTAGDKIEVVLPMQLQIEATPDNDNIAAILYGPIVMAGDFGPVTDKEATRRVGDGWANNKKSLEFKGTPLLVGNRDRPTDWIKANKNEPLSFTLQNAIDNEVISLKPLYKLDDQRYTIYWDLFSPAEWDAYQKESSQHIAGSVHVGDEAEEHKYHLRGQNMHTQVIHFNTCRGAKKDGWFSYDVATHPTEPLFLNCLLWGGGYGTRPRGVFDIFISGNKITTVDLADKQTPVHWVDVSHPYIFYTIVEAIPLQFTKEEKQVNVMFKARTDIKDSGIHQFRLCTAEGLQQQDLLRYRSI